MTAKADFAITDMDEKQSADAFKAIVLFLTTHDCVLTLWGRCCKGDVGAVAQFEERGHLVRRLIFGERSYRVTAENVATVLNAFDLAVLSRKPWGISVRGKPVCLSRSCSDVSLSSTQDVSEQELEALMHLLANRHLVTKWNRVED